MPLPVSTSPGPLTCTVALDVSLTLSRYDAAPPDGPLLVMGPCHEKWGDPLSTEIAAPAVDFEIPVPAAATILVVASSLSTAMAVLTLSLREILPMLIVVAAALL